MCCIGDLSGPVMGSGASKESRSVPFMTDASLQHHKRNCFYLPHERVNNVADTRDVTAASSSKRKSKQRNDIELKAFILSGNDDGFPRGHPFHVSDQSRPVVEAWASGSTGVPRLTQLSSLRSTQSARTDIVDKSLLDGYVAQKPTGRPPWRLVCYRGISCGSWLCFVQKM